MKANPHARITRPPIASVVAIATTMLAAACVPAPPAPAPAPTSAPAPSAAPPPAPSQPAPNWRDAPISPGDWQWGRTTDGSTAQFAGGQFVMRCNTAQRTITLLRPVRSVNGQTAMTITTMQGSRALTAVPAEGGVAATVSARDPVLDAMAFSRGRFAVQTAGSAPLYIPSWTEVSRVIEDCR